jgi:hypothetical protein
MMISFPGTSPLSHWSSIVAPLSADGPAEKLNETMANVSGNHFTFKFFIFPSIPISVGMAERRLCHGEKEEIVLK